MHTNTALRLWPPVVTNMRVAARDLVLPQGGGRDGQHPLFVPQGTAVRWSLYSVHRRQDYFGDDAGDFLPERWESLRTTCVTNKADGPQLSPFLSPFPTLFFFFTLTLLLHYRVSKAAFTDIQPRTRMRRMVAIRRWEYLPFSGGPRTCIGQQFALTQMSYVVTRILQKYEAVEARDERPMAQNMSTTTSLLNGCWVAFKAG